MHFDEVAGCRLPVSTPYARASTAGSLANELEIRHDGSHANQVRTDCEPVRTKVTREAWLLKNVSKAHPASHSVSIIAAFYWGFHVRSR